MDLLDSPAKRTAVRMTEFGEIIDKLPSVRIRATNKIRLKNLFKSYHGRMKQVGDDKIFLIRQFTELLLICGELHEKFIIFTKVIHDYHNREKRYNALISELKADNVRYIKQLNERS